MGNENGKLFECPISEEWRVHWEESRVMYKNIEMLGNAMNQSLKHTAHLSKLDCLERIEENLMSAATGRDQVPTKTVHMLFKVQSAVIIILASCIAFLLMGENFGLIRGLHR